MILGNSKSNHLGAQGSFKCGGGWFFLWSFVVLFLFLSCRVLCCSCCVFVCMTCFSSYTKHSEIVSTSERQDEKQMPRETGTGQGRPPPTGDPHRRERTPQRIHHWRGGAHRGPIQNTHRHKPTPLPLVQASTGGSFGLTRVYEFSYTK